MPEAPPSDLLDLDGLVEFFRPTGHPVSRTTLWRLAKKYGIRNWGTARYMLLSVSDVLVVHADSLPG